MRWRKHKGKQQVIPVGQAVETSAAQPVTAHKTSIVQVVIATEEWWPVIDVSLTETWGPDVKGEPMDAELYERFRIAKAEFVAVQLLLDPAHLPPSWA